MCPKVPFLAPISFSVFINDLSKDIQDKLHLYVDDQIISTSALSAAQALEELKMVFQSL